MNGGRQRYLVKAGIQVAITLKKDQGTNKLTKGIVQDILTNSGSHPRGIKVRLTSGQVGRIQKIYSNNPSTTTSGASTMHTNSNPTVAVAEQVEEEPILPRKPMLFDFFPTTTSAAPSTTTDTSDTSWACQSCTFINHPSLLECEMCQNPKNILN